MVRLGGHQEGYVRPGDAHVGRPAAYVDQLLISGRGGVHHVWACDHYKTTLNADEFKRVYNVETTAGIQHELLPRVSISGNWYRRTFHRLRVTDNLLRTMADYRPYNLFHPITGEPFTVFDVTAAAQRLVPEFDTNSDNRSHVYNAFDATVNTRLPGGALLFGGFVAERNLRNICDEPDDPNLLLFCDKTLGVQGLVRFIA